MKRSIILGGILLIIILITSYFFLTDREDLEEEFSWDGSIILGTIGEISTIERCFSSPNEPNCPIEEMTTVDKNKIRELLGQEGIELCNRVRGEAVCDISEYSSEECTELWTINYETMGTRPNPKSIKKYSCGNEYYLYTSHIAIVGPPSTSLFKIRTAQS